MSWAIVNPNGTNAGVYPMERALFFFLFLEEAGIIRSFFEGREEMFIDLRCSSR